MAPMESPALTERDLLVLRYLARREHSDRESWSGDSDGPAAQSKSSAVHDGGRYIRHVVKRVARRPQGSTGLCVYDEGSCGSGH
jgi:hypothetical protein